MSYSQSYTFSVSGSVDYPASENGGSVSYHDSVTVDLYVDTRPFDSSASQCSRQVRHLTGSVTHAAQEMCSTRQATAKLISRSMIGGFWGMIRSELSQQMTLLATKLPMLLQDLKTRAGQCLEKQEQMRRDYERITNRYYDVFQKLDDNQMAALKQLDLPLFKICDRIDTFVFNGLRSRETSISLLGNLDFIESSTHITVSTLKQNALTMIGNVRRNLEYTKVLNSTLEHMLDDEAISHEKNIFIPAVIISGDPWDDSSAFDRVFVSDQFPQRKRILETLSRTGKNRLTSRCGEFQRNSIDFFLRQKISQFVADHSELQNDKRVVDSMLKLWQISQSTMIS